LSGRRTTRSGWPWRERSARARRRRRRRRRGRKRKRRRKKKMACGKRLGKEGASTGEGEEEEGDIGRGFGGRICDRRYGSSR